VQEEVVKGQADGARFAHAWVAEDALDVISRSDSAVGNSNFGVRFAAVLYSCYVLGAMIRLTLSKSCMGNKCDGFRAVSTSPHGEGARVTVTPVQGSMGGQVRAFAGILPRQVVINGPSRP
jgi:hypothetical protein